MSTIEVSVWEIVMDNILPSVSRFSCLCDILGSKISFYGKTYQFWASPCLFITSWFTVKAHLLNKTCCYEWLWVALWISLPGLKMHMGKWTEKIWDIENYVILHPFRCYSRKLQWWSIYNFWTSPSLPTNQARFLKVIIKYSTQRSLVQVSWMELGFLPCTLFSPGSWHEAIQN